MPWVPMENLLSVDWSAFMKAAGQVAQEVARYKDRVASSFNKLSALSFEATESAPRFEHLDDANECIERLWSKCRELTEKQQRLRERVEKDSRNSSRPPSSDSLYSKLIRYQCREQKPGSQRKQGAQPGHKGVGRGLLPVSKVDEVRVCAAPSHCLECGSACFNPQLSQRKQVAYLKEKRLTITEFQIYRVRCGHCLRVYRGTLPPGTPSGSLGACVLSVIGTLTGRYRLSKRQVAACLLDLFGLKVSIGTISNAEKTVSDSLSEVVLEVHEALKWSPMLHVDETPHYHRHQLRWLWLIANERFAYFTIHRHRSRETAECLLYGKKEDAFWVTDRYSAYYFLPKKQHQYCWSHLKRDIQAMKDHSNPHQSRIGRRLEVLRRLIFREVRRSQAEVGSMTLGRKLRFYLKQFRRTLGQGRDLPRESGGGLCRHLIRNWRRAWNFLQDKKIPATNNHAERLLRSNVLWRKLTLGTQSDRGDRYVERISTVQLSCHLQGKPLLSFLKEALQNHWLGKDPPSLLALHE